MKGKPTHMLFSLLGTLAFGAGCLALDPAPSPITCEYEGQLYADNEVFPAGDGCNTCICNPEEVLWPGQVLCTQRACGTPDASPGYPDASPGYPDASPGYPDASPGYPDASPGYPDAAIRVDAGL